MNRGIRAALIALAAATSASCADFGVDAAKGQLDAARSKWDHAAHSDYQYTVAVGCFCPVGVYRVRVTNGVTVSAVDTVTGMAADSAALRRFGTMERVFDTLKAELDRDPDEYHINYDPANGHPVEASFDFMINAADDELGYTITMELLTP